MKQLVPPERDAAADFDVCVARSRGARKLRLQAQRATVLGLYGAYDAGAWDFDLARPHVEFFPEVERKDLLATYAYTFAGKALARVRARALLSAGKLCPYCQLENPQTLDHFLPKSRFQAFASFSSNLVPMCRTCNTLKGTKGHVLAHQFFTHAYFDTIAADERFLIAQVAVGARHIATNFTIDFGARLSPSVLNRLSYQFSILRLGARYQIEAVDVIRQQAEKMRDMREDGCSIEEVSESVSADALAEVANMGPSYWRSALLTALAANADFLNEGYERAL